MPTRATGGFTVVSISNASDTRNTIVDWIQEDGDYVVAVDYNMARYIRFSNRVFPGQAGGERPVSGWPGIAYDPPADGNPPAVGPSQETAFDDRALSSRSGHFQRRAVLWFAANLIAPYLRPRNFILTPARVVLEAVEELLDGRLPETGEDLAKLIGHAPAVLHHLQCVPGTFEPSELTEAARTVIFSILEDRATLERFLEAPEDVVQELGQGELTVDEQTALLQLARQEPEHVQHAFDTVALGGSQNGDGNVCLLIGFDAEHNRPDEEGWEWLVEQLPIFYEQNGFWPSFGYFVSEAQKYHRVILGPGVSERERQFLAFDGRELIDRRKGEPYAGRLDDPIWEPGGKLARAG